MDSESRGLDSSPHPVRQVLFHGALSKQMIKMVQVNLPEGAPVVCDEQSISDRGEGSKILTMVRSPYLG